MTDAVEGYVAVAVFPNKLDAELARATLAAAGIESFVKSDDSGGMLPSLQEIRGVRVLVHRDNLDEARTILTSEASEDTSEQQ